MAFFEKLKEDLKPAVLCLTDKFESPEQIMIQDTMDLASMGVKVQFVGLIDSPVWNRLPEHPQIERVGLDFIPNEYFDYRFRSVLQALVDQKNINLLHLHQMAYLGSVIPWLRKRRDLALVVSRHALSRKRRRGLFHRLLYSRLDALIVTSQALRASVLQNTSISERQVKVIHLGLDLERFDPMDLQVGEIRESWGLSEDDIVIGTYGAEERIENPTVLIKAAASLRKKKRIGDQKLRFMLVHPEEWDMEHEEVLDLKELIHSYGLEDCVHWMGAKEKTREVFRGLDLFVVPARQETLSLTVLQAMAMECPVILSQGGVSTEILGEEEYGLMMRHLDAFDLQRQIRYLLDHPMERVRMAERARDHVSKLFDQKLRMNRILELYDRLLRRKRAHLRV